MPLMRLDKLLGDMGIASRSELKQMIKRGRVTVDGRAVTAPETKVDSEGSSIALDGEELRYKSFHYYMMDKPAGVLSATEDGKQKTVLDLVSPEMRRMGLFPVGRLDKDTEGLLLLTNDGNLTHKLLSPKYHVDKVYYARVEGCLETSDIEAFAAGMVLGDGLVCLPAGLEILSDHEALVTLQEGKFHQVKRMLACRGKPVQYLKRLRMGPLILDEKLPCGAFRPLRTEEIEVLRTECSIDRMTKNRQ